MSLRLQPGGILWLLHHELRLYLRRMGAAGKTGPSRGTIVGAALAVLLLHGFAWSLLSATGGRGAADDATLAIGASLLFALVFSMMLSQGIKNSVAVLFERGDLDLLLSSPLPSRSIFSVRLGAVALGSAALYLLLLAPFAHVGLLLGQPHWLAIYPLVLGAAATAASLSMLLTLGLVRLLGIRRSRVLAQLLGALVGALFFLLSQLYTNLGMSHQHQLAGWLRAHMGPAAALGPHSLLWLPGRAALGEPLPLLALAAVGAAAFVLTVHFTHGFFVHGMQQAVSLVKNPLAPPGGPRYRFGRGLAFTVMLKEWRLIRRDPQLISQVLLQLLYMLPLAIMLVVKANAVLPGMGASLTFLSTSLTTALAWLIIAAEDAPDLLRGAPARSATVAAAKLAAALVPTLLLVAAPLLWLAWRQPLAALLLALFVAAASVSAALVVRWSARPAARGDFRQRSKDNLLGTFFELGTSMAWSALAWMALSLTQTGPARPGLLVGGAALLLLLLTLLTIARLRRSASA